MSLVAEQFLCYNYYYVFGISSPSIKEVGRGLAARHIMSKKSIISTLFGLLPATDLEAHGIHKTDGLAITSALIALMALIGFLPEGNDLVARPIAIMLLIVAALVIVPKAFRYFYGKKHPGYYMVDRVRGSIVPKMVISIICTICAAIILQIATVLVLYVTSCSCTLIVTIGVIAEAANVTYKAFCYLAFLLISKKSKKQGVWYTA